MLTQYPLKPLPLERWEALAENDDYAGVAAQAIYGEDFTPETENKSAVVSMFNQAQEQQNRFSFSMFAADISVNTARGMALYFTDKQVKRGAKYLYMVYPACNDTVSCDTAYVYTGPDEYVPLIKPVFTQAITGNNTVTLQWRSPEGRWGYSAFEIERSADAGKTFTSINKAPMINTMPEKQLQDYHFYIDSLPDNNHTYYYRLRGLNPFGEKGPYTDTISVKGKDVLSITPRVTSHVAGKQGVELAWEIDPKAEKQIAAFKVMRSPNAKSGWTPVSGKLPASSRNFIDVNPIPTAYYKISAWGTGGDISSSFPVLEQQADSIPPEPPTGLTGQVDTTGKITLRWKANTEPDIYGYRVYRANAPEEEFSQLTVKPIGDTLFTDKVSLKTLTRHVYYKVMATDKRQNYSRFSAVLEIERPDIVPPVPPVVTDIYSTTKGVTIQFVHSTSSDVVTEYILRREAGNSKWDTCGIITQLDSLFTDSPGTSATRYEYMPEARDKAGLVSKTMQLVSGVKLAVPPAKPILKAMAKKTESKIELQWQPVPQGQFQIYRAGDEGKLHLYTTLDSQNSSFTDKNVKPGHTYRYQLKYVGENGVAMGNQVNVNY
jgi:fibronectin type 3 domain-containing protein